MVHQLFVEAELGLLSHQPYSHPWQSVPPPISLPPPLSLLQWFTSSLSLQAGEGHEAPSIVPPQTLKAQMRTIISRLPEDLQSWLSPAFMAPFIMIHVLCAMGCVRFVTFVYSLLTVSCTCFCYFYYSVSQCMYM